jgi:hypothetical protein
MAVSLEFEKKGRVLTHPASPAVDLERAGHTL